MFFQGKICCWLFATIIVYTSDKRFQTELFWQISIRCMLHWEVFCWQDQYMLVHDALVEYLLCPTTEIKQSDVKVYTEKLAETPLDIMPSLLQNIFLVSTKEMCTGCVYSWSHASGLTVTHWIYILSALSHIVMISCCLSVNGIFRIFWDYSIFVKFAIIASS